jgi:transcriptional regulator GlxA family with amidase domain
MPRQIAFLIYRDFQLFDAATFGRAARVDTLMVAGGEGSRCALSCPKTRRFIPRCTAEARRTSSVCSEAYLLVERLRAEAARGALAGSGRSVRNIARAHGFGNPERMRRTFRRLFGVTPSAVKH